MPRCEACDAGPFNAADLTPPLTPSMEPLNRGQLSSSLDLESGTLTEELVASATINGVPLQPVTVCPHARMALACGFRLSGLMLLRELKVEDWGTVRSGQATVSSRSLSAATRVPMVTETVRVSDRLRTSTWRCTMQKHKRLGTRLRRICFPVALDARHGQVG